MPRYKAGDYSNYTVYVSDRAWRAFPAYRRGQFLDGLDAATIVEQPMPRIRDRRCIRLELNTAAKLEVIATLNKIRNPWLPSSTGTRYGSGKIGLAIEALGQALATKGNNFRIRKVAEDNETNNA